MVLLVVMAIIASYIIGSMNGPPTLFGEGLWKLLLPPPQPGSNLPTPTGILDRLFEGSQPTPCRLFMPPIPPRPTHTVVKTYWLEPDPEPMVNGTLIAILAGAVLTLLWIFRHRAAAYLERRSDALQFTRPEILALFPGENARIRAVVDAALASHAPGFIADCARDEFAARTTTAVTQRWLYVVATAQLQRSEHKYKALSQEFLDLYRLHLNEWVARRGAEYAEAGTQTQSRSVSDLTTPRPSFPTKTTAGQSRDALRAARLAAFLRSQRQRTLTRCAGTRRRPQLLVASSRRLPTFGTAVLVRRACRALTQQRQRLAASAERQRRTSAALAEQRAYVRSVSAALDGARQANRDLVEEHDEELTQLRIANEEERRGHRETEREMRQWVESNWPRSTEDSLPLRREDLAAASADADAGALPTRPAESKGLAPSFQEQLEELEALRERRAALDKEIEEGENRAQLLAHIEFGE